MDASVDSLTRVMAMDLKFVSPISDAKYSSDNGIVKAEERKGGTVFSYAEEKWLLLAKFELYKIRLIKTLHSSAHCIGDFSGSSR